MARLISDVVLRELLVAGVVDKDTHRVVIDLRLGHAIAVYVEKHGSDKLVEIIKANATVLIAEVENGINGGNL